MEELQPYWKFVDEHSRSILREARRPPTTYGPGCPWHYVLLTPTGWSSAEMVEADPQLEETQAENAGMEMDVMTGPQARQPP